MFRYDTRDVVRRLPDEPPTCELAGVPGTSQILGKADHLLPLDHGVVTLRDLVEVVEGLPAQPWPGRFGARVEGDRLELRLPSTALEGVAPDDVRRRFAARGLDLDIATIVDDRQAASLRPLRADLLETTFAGRT